MNRAAFNKCVTDAGGLQKLATVLRESPQTITNWRERGVPPGKCKAFAAATGVSVKRLRPRDWRDYWPELADASVSA